mgnify:FL=1
MHPNIQSNNVKDDPQPRKWQIWLASGGQLGKKPRPALIFDVIEAADVAFICPLYSTNKHPMETATRIVILPYPKYGLKKPSQVAIDRWGPLPYANLRYLLGEIDTCDQEVFAHLLRSQCVQEAIARIRRHMSKGLDFEAAVKALVADA